MQELGRVDRSSPGPSKQRQGPLTTRCTAGRKPADAMLGSRPYTLCHPALPSRQRPRHVFCLGGDSSPSS